MRTYFRYFGLVIAALTLAGCAGPKVETAASMLDRIESSGLVCEADVDEMLSKTNQFGTDVVYCGDGAGGGVYTLMVAPAEGPFPPKFTSLSLADVDGTFCGDSDAASVAFGRNWVIFSDSVLYPVSEIADSLGAPTGSFDQEFCGTASSSGNPTEEVTPIEQPSSPANHWEQDEELAVAVGNCGLGFLVEDSGLDAGVHFVEFDHTLEPGMGGFDCVLTQLGFSRAQLGTVGRKVFKCYEKSKPLDAKDDPSVRAVLRQACEPGKNRTRLTIFWD